MITHRILFAREGEPETNALLELDTYEIITAEEAFERFHGVMQRFLTETDIGKKLDAESRFDFNIGDLLTNEVTILTNEEFTAMMAEQRFGDVRVESPAAEKLATYDFHLGR